MPQGEPCLDLAPIELDGVPVDPLVPLTQHPGELGEMGVDHAPRDVTRAGPGACRTPAQVDLACVSRIGIKAPGMIGVMAPLGEV